MGWYLFILISSLVLGFISGVNCMTSRIKKQAKQTMSIEIEGKLYRLHELKLVEKEKK